MRHTKYSVASTLLVFCWCIIASRGYREDQHFWRNLGRKEIDEALSVEKYEKFAKNVILFIGDGMGPTTVTASRIYKSGEQGFLAWETFRNIGVLKTYSADKIVPDSCSTATAMFTGVKANQKTSGVDASVQLDDCEASLKPEARLEGIMGWAMAAGKSTGFVTTTRVTHATPSALYAHTPNRRWECEAEIPTGTKCKDIARQLIEDLPGRNINVIMGGGRQELVSNVTGTTQDPIDTWGCYSSDGRDLIRDWISEKKSRGVTGAVLSTTEDLEKLNPKTDYVLGIFANGHMKMEHERDKGPKGTPSLSSMTKKAIEVLRKNEQGYVLMVEGGMIDFGHHRGHARKALDETAALSDAVKAALAVISVEDTLIVVTSDHAHSMVLVGYAERGSSILDLAQASKIDSIPYTSLLYGTGGPNNFQFEVNGGKLQRRDPSINDTKSYEYTQQSVVLTDEVTHSGTDVLIYARGPMAHLVHSVREQTFVAYLISYAAQIGPMKSTTAKSYTAEACIFSCLVFHCIRKLLISP